MTHDTLFATAQAIGSAILSLSATLDELRPDFLVVYADRYEGFAAMITGTQMNIPTAHIEGGDYTEGGALDDSVRHAMTKLAHLHFATNEQAVARILGLGEEPWRVFNVGQPALDLVAAGTVGVADIIRSGTADHQQIERVVEPESFATHEFAGETQNQMISERRSKQVVV